MNQMRPPTYQEPPTHPIACRLGLPEYEAMEAFVRYDPDAPSHLFKTPRPAHDDPAHLALKTAEARGGT